MEELEKKILKVQSEMTEILDELKAESKARLGYVYPGIGDASKEYTGAMNWIADSFESIMEGDSEE